MVRFICMCTFNNTKTYVYTHNSGLTLMDRCRQVPFSYNAMQTKRVSFIWVALVYHPPGQWLREGKKAQLFVQLQTTLSFLCHRPGRQRGPCNTFIYYPPWNYITEQKHAPVRPAAGKFASVSLSKLMSRFPPLNPTLDYSSSNSVQRSTGLLESKTELCIKLSYWSVNPNDRTNGNTTLNTKLLFIGGCFPPPQKNNKSPYRRISFVGNSEMKR